MPEQQEASTKPQIECATRTDVGLVRNRNEDSLWVDAKRGWLLLADGMGGHRSGDLASALAVSYVSSRLRTAARAGKMNGDDDYASLLVKSVVDANAVIRGAGQTMGSDVMGSTFIGAVLDGEQLIYVYLGDSRIYLWRDGALTQLTRDHTLVQEFVDAGRLTPELAQGHPYRGLLTRGLGVSDVVEPETGICTLQERDRLLLCSDGLTDMVDEDEIARLLGAAASADEVAMSLIEAAKRAGGRDNVSVIVAWFVAQAHD
ncbi:MAG: protein phosphatase 2C domain-containing protein [Azoarcus sp.]|jgi:protein phosphatase|nr:protein phosphatase 2C domain-containing protein [Azoarcus sp.]